MGKCQGFGSICWKKTRKTISWWWEKHKEQRWEREREGGTRERTKWKELSKHFFWNSDFSLVLQQQVLRRRIFLGEFSSRMMRWAKFAPSLSFLPLQNIKGHHPWAFSVIHSLRHEHVEPLFITFIALSGGRVVCVCVHQGEIAIVWKPFLEKASQTAEGEWCLTSISFIE